MEIKANQNGYKTTSINADGMIVKSETINVVFINSKGKVPSTGDSVNLQFLVAIIGCSSLLLYYVSRKKRLHNSL